MAINFSDYPYPGPGLLDDPLSDDELRAKRAAGRLSGGAVPPTIGTARRVRPQMPQLPAMPQTHNGAYRPGPSLPTPRVLQSPNIFGSPLGMFALAAALKNGNEKINWDGPRSTPDQYLPPEQVPQFTPEQLAILANQSPPNWFDRTFLGQGGFGGGGGGPVPSPQQVSVPNRGIFDGLLSMFGGSDAEDDY